MTSVIIEDDMPGRQVLVELIERYVPDMHIKGIGNDVNSGINAIMETKPNVVFLDVRLGNHSGFDIIHQIPHKNFLLVITSAYEEYALLAIKEEALDYLLKPITKTSLLNTIQRVRKRLMQKDHLFEYHWPSVRQALHEHPKDKISVPSSEGHILIALKQILRCEAQGSYTKIILKDRLPAITTRNLGEYEKILIPSLGFFRIHHSIIVNVNEVIRYADENSQLLMSDGTTVDISRRKRNEFVKWLEKI